MISLPYQETERSRKCTSRDTRMVQPHCHMNPTFKSFPVSTKMKIISIFVVILMVSNLCVAVEYANQWIVTVEGGDVAAQAVADSGGFINHGRLFHDDSTNFVFSHNQVVKRSLWHSTFQHGRLSSHPSVVAVEQQTIKRRVKRSISSFDPNIKPIDPLWPDTWYLKPETTPSMKVTEAWKAGYSGKNVVVTILDDGIEYTHPDLAANYDPDASSDINDHDDDPMPRPTYNNENRHGTRCAGEVAAVANNNYCSIGIAYDARIGGVRMLDGSVTDAVEAQSIGLRPDHIDIYSASWGPDDDGRTVDGPAKRAKEAFEKGITKGRGGKGSIFVWASGNGGRKSDNCNCDGYTNSIYTLSISSTTQNTNKPWYSEDCSSTLATTYSSGVSSEKQIVTTDLAQKCTKSHTGTSASAPLAGGICALALEANRNLSWRDMQHIVVRTANPTGLKANNDWKTNGVGRKEKHPVLKVTVMAARSYIQLPPCGGYVKVDVSHSYGYGMMDAYAMVMLAKTWKTVPTQRRCNVTIVKEGSRISYSTSHPFRREFTVTDCEGVRPDKLEHVQAVISASSSRRGDMHIYLTSPMGATSTLLGARPLDDRQGSFNKWPFMTTHNWDENPMGTWALEIRTESSRANSQGHIDYFELVMYGTLNEDWPDGLSQGDSAHNGFDNGSSNIKDVHHEDNRKRPNPGATTIPNCKSADEIGKLCIACEDGYFMSADHSRCFQQCPSGYYLAYEKRDDKVPRESVQDETEADKDRKVCKLCTGAPYCIACSGPKVNNCLGCESGFDIKDGRCVLNNNMSESSKIYILSITVCVLSVVLFIFLFLFLHFCVKRGTACCNPKDAETLYSYVPNEDGGSDKNEAEVKYKNGKIRNHDDTVALLSDSDDERT